MFAYAQMQNGRVSLLEKLRIMNFLKNRHWDLLISSGFVPEMGAVWGKEVQKMDAQTGQMVSFGKTEWKKLLRIPFAALSCMFRAFFLPPKKDISG